MSKEKRIGLQSRHRRIRKKIKGSSQRPRVSVYRSHKYLYVQLIDDVAGKTLASVSTFSKEGKKKEGKNSNNVLAAKDLGKLLGEVAKTKKIEQVVFDRSGYKYAGKVKALAEGAREAGLKF